MQGAPKVRDRWCFFSLLFPFLLFARRCYEEVGKRRKMNSEHWNSLYYGERQKSWPFCPSVLPTLAVSSLYENTALRRRNCPKIFCGFWLTLLDLKLVAVCASPFCRSWSEVATLDGVAWPKRAIRILPAIHFAFWVTSTSMIWFVF